MEECWLEQRNTVGHSSRLGGYWSLPLGIKQGDQLLVNSDGGCLRVQLTRKSVACLAWQCSLRARAQHAGAHHEKTSLVIVRNCLRVYTKGLIPLHCIWRLVPRPLIKLWNLILGSRGISLRWVVILGELASSPAI